MSADISEDHTALRDGAARFAEDVFGPGNLRALRENPDGANRQALTRAAQDGWLSILVPEDLGGAGQDVLAAAFVCQAFGAHLSNIPAGPAMAALAAVAEVPHWREARAFQDALAGTATILPALAGLNAVASDLKGADRGGLVCNRSAGGAAFINGLRTLVHAGGAADYFLLEVDDSAGTMLALVPRNHPGLEITSRQTIDGGSVTDLHFRDCVFGGDDILFESIDSRRIAGRMRSTLNILLASELAGIMETAIDLTLEHLRTREQFGRSLGSFQALQFRMADVHMQMSLSRALTTETARLAGEQSASVATTAAAAFAKAAETAVTTARTMIQMHGAMGFTDEHDAGLYLKRAVTLANAYGTAAQNRITVAAQTLSREEAEPIRFREDTAEDAKFRAEVRAWLDTSLPDHLRNLPTRPSPQDAEMWHRKLYERGWVAPAWPKQYGGMEATIPERIILIDELANAGAPEISGQALGHLGPILQRFGTPEQKAQHLPGMISGDVLWCQGYSEPSSGSDLASLRTRAIRDGDDFIINGQKIWTTWAHYADWMFCLVRTDPEAPKQKGISFILIDMKTPGITPRGIHTITGEDEFAEVFFDDVRVPVSNVVGEIDAGWTVATALLEQERLNGSNPQKAGHLLGKVKRAARHSGMIDDPAFRDRLVQAEIDYVALCATYAQIVRTTERDIRTNADYAFAKLIAAELQQTLCELMIEALGAEGTITGSLDLGSQNRTIDRLYPGVTYLQNRRATIYGGTSEVQ
ncbi:MAG: acyl-CoA dehydrogenase, partial [Hyphomicrobiales bacterium]|nr:acyl-CoA dehydrogenase [Hyphomicrobiales bacterium]